MVGFEVLAVFCLLRLLAAAKLPAERVLIYAWNPLPVWAFAGNGHVDAVAIGWSPPRCCCGCVIGTAGRGWRWGWRS